MLKTNEELLEENAKMDAEKLGVELILPIISYQKIMDYTTACKDEISGFADVEFNKEKNQLIVGDVYLLDQTCGGADTHLEEEAVAKFNIEMIKKGKKQLPQLWWHSHVEMPTFFSGTDEDTCKTLQNDTFNIALVVNKKFEMKAKMYVHVETKTKMFGTLVEKKEYAEIDPLPVHVSIEHTKIPAIILEEVKKKVKPHKVFFEFGGGKKKKHDLNHDLEAGKYGHIDHIAFLPKDRKMALDRINKDGLRRRFDYTLNQWVFEDDMKGLTWVDQWEVVQLTGNILYD